MGLGISSVAEPYLDRSVFGTAVFERFSSTRSPVEPGNQAQNQRFQNNLNSVNIIENSTSKRGISPGPRSCVSPCVFNGFYL